MFCSWRKSPSAPCSCAFLLRGSLPELLNHLCCLGESTLVLRQQGLSLAKCTRFGLSVATRESGWQVLHDHLSGMETDIGRTLSLYLLANVGDRKPVIGIAEPGLPLHATIRLDHHDWNSQVVANLIDHFEGVSLDCLESRRLGAGAWLDEWERPVANQEAIGMDQACQILHECRELEVSVSVRGSQGSARFEPSFVDACGSVLRVADRGRRHVVHADVQDPGFRLFRTDRYGLRLCVEDQSGSTMR
jgi:hypothetical protein